MNCNSRIIFDLSNTANMKRTFTSQRTSKDERIEYTGLAIVVAGFVAMIIGFLSETIFK